MTASNTLHICCFTANFIARLKGITNIASLLKILFPYTNWCDHSIIRELVEACDCPEGVQLLDEFDSRIDVTLPVTAYPIPAPSNLMIPSESSTHTVMAVKCQQKLSSLTLSHIGVIKSLINDKFTITKHACLLLAVRATDVNHSSAIFWLIPKGVTPLISKAVLEHSGFLLTNGLVEISICPSFSFSTDNTNMYRIWAMNYYSDTVTLSMQVSLYNITYVRMYVYTSLQYEFVICTKNFYETKYSQVCDGLFY